MFTVIDIETTGFSEINNDIIEFAYIQFDDNNNYVKAEQLYFYYEGMSWSEEAYRVHNISLDFLKTQKDKFRENLIKMYSVLNHANVIGHNNLRFDCPFIKTWLMRQGIKNLEYNIIQDTMLAYKPVYKKSRIKLTKLVDYIGVTPEIINTLLPVWFPGAESSQAHEAAYDVVATALLALRGLDKKLLTFEPLVTLQQDYTTLDTESLYAEGENLVVGNDDYIVSLNDAGKNNWVLVQHSTSGSVKDFIKTEAVKDLLNKTAHDKKVLPITLTKKVDNTYIGDYNGITFTLNCSKSETFELEFETSYGKFNNGTISIPMIIQNTFTDKDIVDFILSKEE